MQPESANNLRVRTKTWIENENKELLFGKGKTEILEYIEQEGSIVRAAKKMGLSYKKAWSHIKILQTLIHDELVLTKQGGHGKGGSSLTPKAEEVIAQYRQLQRDIEDFANKRFQELFFPGSSTKE